MSQILILDYSIIIPRGTWPQFFTRLVKDYIINWQDYTRSQKIDINPGLRIGFAKEVFYSSTTTRGRKKAESNTNYLRFYLDPEDNFPTLGDLLKLYINPKNKELFVCVPIEGIELFTLLIP